MWNSRLISRTYRLWTFRSIWICPPEFGPAPLVTVTCLMQRLHATFPALTAPPDRPFPTGLNPCPGDLKFWRESLTKAQETDPQEASPEEGNAATMLML